MTSEEKRLIADCRVMIIGTSDFIDYVKAELYRSGFKSINIVSGNDVHTEIGPVDMVAEYVGEACTRVKGNVAIPIIYPFDFVDGASAIVVMPGDDSELHGKANARLWAAEYMAGSSVFCVPTKDSSPTNFEPKKIKDDEEYIFSNLLPQKISISSNMLICRSLLNFYSLRGYDLPTCRLHCISQICFFK